MPASALSVMVDSSMCAWDTARGAVIGADLSLSGRRRPGVSIVGMCRCAIRLRLAEGGMSSVGLRGSLGRGVVANIGGGRACPAQEGGRTRPSIPATTGVWELSIGKVPPTRLW